MRQFIRIAIYTIGISFFIGCTEKKDKSSFEGDFLIKSSELSETCSQQIIDFLEPMELENDSVRISEIHQLFVSIDTTIYEKEELERVLFLGLIFNNDKSNYEILALYPEMGMIYFSYLIKKNSTLLIANNSSFWNDFKLLEGTNCLLVHDSTRYAKISKEQIGYWGIAGKSSVNGAWLPDTVNHDTFIDKSLNNKWILQGSLEMKETKFVDSNDNVIFSEKIDFENGRLVLLNKKQKFPILCMTPKAIFLYDNDNDLLHRLNKK